MRLIDADKITSGEIAKYLGRGYEFCIPDIEDMLKEQPTAYDVDKVVEQLEKELQLADKEKARCARENPLQFDSAKGYASGIATAIEIVKGGGVDERNDVKTNGNQAKYLMQHADHERFGSIKIIRRQYIVIFAKKN